MDIVLPILANPLYYDSFDNFIKKNGVLLSYTVFDY